MRCEDLTRELACPTGAISQAELAGHLASCSACAEWSRQATRLDRLWEETRPIAPSADALDALWARASVELDARRTPATLKLVRPTRRRWVVAGYALAQAAALVVAAVVLLRGQMGEPLQVADATGKPAQDADPEVVFGPRPGVKPATEPKLFDFEADSDVLPVVRIDKKNVATLEQVDLSYRFDSPSIPTGTQKDLMDGGETMVPFGGVLASLK